MNLQNNIFEAVKILTPDELYIYVRILGTVKDHDSNRDLNGESISLKAGEVLLTSTRVSSLLNFGEDRKKGFRILEKLVKKQLLSKVKVNWGLNSYSIYRVAFECGNATRSSEEKACGNATILHTKCNSIYKEPLANASALQISSELIQKEKELREMQERIKHIDSSENLFTIVSEIDSAASRINDYLSYLCGTRGVIGSELEDAFKRFLDPSIPIVRAGTRVVAKNCNEYTIKKDGKWILLQNK